MVSARRGTLRLLRALMIGAVLVPAALFAYVAWVSWHSADAITDDRLARSLDVLHEHALKVLTTGNLVLDEIVESVEGETSEEIAAREPEMHRRLKRVADLLPQVQSIWVIGRDGLALANSYFVPAPRGASLADRDFFRALVDRDIGTYVSSVFVPRLIEGPSFFSMSRRLNGPDGGLQGVASVSMLPDDFQKFYREIARGPGEVFALMREDGAFLARWPGGPSSTDKLPPSALFFGEIARRPERGLYTGVSRLDGVERRVGYRRVEGFPIYVIASIDTATIRDEWLRGLLGHLVFGLPATLLLLWVLWVAHQRTAGLYAEAVRREAAETALRHAQRLEAVGRLTGGVAHDFNNLLMVISGSADRLRRIVQGEKESRLVEMITTAAKRGETLTRQLLSFSRQQALSPQGIDLSQRMPELSELVRRSLADDVEVTIDVPDRACPVKVDPGEFEVAVLNICVNARDAMPNGGRLVVRVRDAVLDEAGDGGLEGAFVALSFTDTGSGIPDDVLPRVFEPFFTTKETAKGTGLGLSQVYGFARQAGGDVRIDSRVGAGTTVTLWLPRVPFEPVAAEPRPEPAAAPAGRKTVLVVEDNLSVADVCRSYLDQLGYEAAFAASPREALAALADGHGVDLVLSDILMPGGMSGFDLARELRTLQPSLPIVLMTGFSDRAGEVACDGFPVLRKPFDIDALQRELAAAFARRDGTAAA
ncbi:ATP-binding protein [Rhodoplanes sp. TEM]|uniref:histidine kinase n=1 Tax=Rhodoplanes tepidamans TaxID=200616 RepID=A0ABT5JBD8_RHOTP|nr:MULTISPECIES: hybrid sensor histidine kinase/response regulator [Rhodoplanes]MDC7786365.1 ATP-binding protein [Rhodoplanes tepidamans]MDC7985437.1 ATP-binding protein [Rhodoplanes sp. TEM]MDQ0354109.1 two-component system NtrC family sensor kinase [Rhodoplanes tepidamans]